jgi:hypothetical protein
MKDELTELLLKLDGIRQNPRYHPEGDALFHSLQVFDCARKQTDDPVLWAAALFHDVGKALGGPDHDQTGADLLDGLLCPRAVFLVEHHLDLMKHPGATRRRFRGTRQLNDLEQLRRWDLLGRNPRAMTSSAHLALEMIFQHPGVFALDNHDNHDISEVQY